MMRATILLAAASALFVGAVGFAQSRQEPDRWWSPGEGRTFPASLDYKNDNGTLRLLLDGGPMETAGHPFFYRDRSQRPRLRHLPPAGRCDEPVGGLGAAPVGPQRRQGSAVRGE